MRRQRWGRIFGTLVWMTCWLGCREAVAATTFSDVESMECRADGSCTTSQSAQKPSSCDLYMAPSSIAGSARWGVYTSTDIPENSTIDMLDVVIPIVFDRSQTRLQKQLYGIDLPHSLLDDYTREISVMVVNDTDAGGDDNVRVEGLAPGLGMLARSHRGWTNMNPTTCRSQGAGPRFHVSAGASSNFQECGFAAARFIPAGHELFQGYGKDRIPQRTTGTADRKTKSTMARSVDWLKQNGICIDNIRVETPHEQSGSHSGTYERRAVARRFLAARSVVTAAPVVPLSRSHVAWLLVDKNGEPADTILWKGHQLVLNYCWGHASSSVLLFPYGPAVNLINHAGGGRNETPNVAIRWSPLTKQSDWFKLNATAVVHNHHGARGSLVLEYYALRDIAPDEALLLDYGADWQTAWDQHVEQWTHFTSLETRNVDMAYTEHLASYQSAWDYTQACNDEIERNQTPDCLYQTPSWIDVRCHVASLATLMVDEEEPEWRSWQPPTDARAAHEAWQSTGGLACRVQVVDGDGTYRVQIHANSNGESVNVKHVPRSAIVLLDQPYTGNQFLRHAFRHEMQLPHDMMPLAWRDLDPKPDESCGLYMAESSIPHAGLGMFTARTIPTGAKIFSGEVVVQVEDYETNARFRQWATGQHGSTFWLLQNYFWSAKVSIGNFDGVYIESLIPGLGMLANSHVGMVGAHLKAPKRNSILQKRNDPGTGASTIYHDVFYTAGFDIEAGAELYVDYGDDWFSGREQAIGVIPLRQDFAEADALMNSLWRLYSKLHYKSSRILNDALQIISFISAPRPRLAALIPKDATQLRLAVQQGTAKLTVPNRIRSASWLKKNGRCIDNIRPDVSTVRQAGHGAFATRFIRKGDVISPMPLVHVRRHHMEVYDGDDHNDPNGRFWMVDKQLLLNYCYGHRDSSILLFPYSPVVNYVNHNLTEFNAILRWSTLPNHRADWLLRTPEDLTSEDHAGLILEMVATRDIKAGEEVFLSYGVAWDTAWKNFADSWRPTDMDLRHSSTGELNERLAWIKTMEERGSNPYRFSNDVVTVCFVGSFDWLVPDRQDDANVRTVKWIGSYRLFDSADYAYECEIKDRHFSGHVNQVYDRFDSVEPMEMLHTVIIRLESETVQVVDVPRKAIQFFDAQYKAEYLSRNTFRHEIQIPDSLLPDAWRDLTSAS